MRVAYFDPFSGVSGDMTVGALIDAGASARRLIHGLEHLGLGATFKAEKTIRHGIAATKFHVLVDGEAADHIHDHDHDHDHGHHHAVTHDHSHRGLPQILDLIERAHIPPEVKATSSQVFKTLGEAEAAIHGIPVDQVHFHEVGAVDSIADIVGACFGLYLLKVDEVHSAPINVGSGTVKAAHGVLPVPAPATARLLAGKPVYVDGPSMELTTPTGAAILAALAKSYGPMPALNIHSLGYGAGAKDFPNRANVLRITIGDRLASPEAQTVLVLEANIDDCSPQVLGYTMDQLFLSGALDVTLTPVLMKKNRAGHLLSVVARPEDKDVLSSLILRETTTLGLRITSAERRTLPRQFLTVSTPYGSVRIKVTGNGFAPEYDDCQSLAREHNVPLKDILTAANFAYLKNKS
jgi:uncharacterized protein (TIGR00299 family) protein